MQSRGRRVSRMARIRGTCAGNLVVALGLLVLLSDCSGKPSSSVPSEADGRKAVENTMSQSSHGLVRLLSFAKTNGKTGEVSGVKSYEMEYRAELEFLAEAWYR